MPNRNYRRLLAVSLLVVYQVRWSQRAEVVPALADGHDMIGRPGHGDGVVFLAPLVAATLARLGALTVGRPRSNQAVFV